MGSYYGYVDSCCVLFCTQSERKKVYVHEVGLALVIKFYACIYRYRCIYIYIGICVCKALVGLRGSSCSKKGEDDREKKTISLVQSSVQHRHKEPDTAS